MRAVKDFCQVVRDFNSDFDFVVIYVEEAHAIDGAWPVPMNRFDISTHRSMEDRMLAARHLVPYINCCPIYLDNMENAACTAYGAFPERFYVIIDGVIRFASDEGPMNYSVPELRKALENLSMSQKIGKSD